MTLLSLQISEIEIRRLEIMIELQRLEFERLRILKMIKEIKGG